MKELKVYIPSRLIRSKNPDHLYWYILVRLFCINNGEFNQTPIIQPDVLVSIFHPDSGRRTTDRVKAELNALAELGYLNRHDKHMYILPSVIVKEAEGYIEIPLNAVKKLVKVWKPEGLLATYCAIMATRTAASGYKTSRMSQELLAEMVGCSERTMRENVKRLKELELIDVKRNSFGPIESGGAISNEYSARKPKAAEKKQEPPKKKAIAGYVPNEYVMDFDLYEKMYGDESNS